MTETLKRMSRTVLSDAAKEQLRTDLAKMAASYSEDKEAEKKLKESVKDQQAAIVTVLEQLGQKSFTTELPSGQKVTVTRSQKSSTTVNVERLKKLIGATRFRKLLSLTFDKNKLDAAIKAGEITAVDVADCTETSDGAPYITLTRG